jgi:hypothetical protein
MPSPGESLANLGLISTSSGSRTVTAPHAKKDSISPFETAEGLMEQINASIHRGYSG